MFGSSNTSLWNQQPQQQQQQQQQQQPQQMGLFGQQPVQTGFGAPAQAPAFGTTFGQPAQPAQQQQSAFGTGTSTFGGFGTQNRTAFGAAPAPSGGLFGAQPQNAAPTTTFGGFGAAATNTAQPSTGLFGAKPTGFGTTGGFGTTTTTPAFGSGTATQTAFGQPQSTGFGAPTTTGFGAATGANQTNQNQNFGTGNPAFQAYTERDQGTTVATTNTFQTITAMVNYRNWSLEELRLQDYVMGKKAPSAAAPGGFGAPASTGFGQPAAGTTGGLFGSNTGTAFGQTQSQPSLFGAQPQATQPTTGFGGFGQPAQQPATTAFGQPAQTGGLFGSTATTNTAFGAQPAAQPAATGFGATQTTGFGFGTPQNQQAKPAFGFGATTTPAATTTTGFGFGQPAQQPAASTSPFGFGQQAQQPAQPASTGFSLFGQKATTPTSTPSAGGFAFGQPATTQAAPAAGGFSFGATATTPTPAQPAAGGLFGAQPATTGFAFGAATAAPATAPSFSFAQPQAQQAAPAAGGFAFGAPAQQQPATGGLFGAAAPATTQAGGLFGATAAKPATGLFGAPATTQAAPAFSFGQPAAPAGGTSLFGGAPAATAPASGFSFGQPAATQAAPAGGLFGAAPAAQPGGLFGTASTSAATQPSLFGASTQQPQAPSLGGSIFGAAPTNVGFGTQLPPGQQPLVATIDQNPYGINPFLQQTLSAGTAAAGAASTGGSLGASTGTGGSPAQDQPKRVPPLPQFKTTPRLQSKLKLKNYLGGGVSSVPPSEMGNLESFEAAISPDKFTPRKNVKKLVLEEATMLSNSVGIGSAVRGGQGRREITWGDDTTAPAPPEKERPAASTAANAGAGASANGMASSTADSSPKRGGATSEASQTNGSIYPSLADLPSGRTRPTPPATPRSFNEGEASQPASPRSPGFADSTDYKTSPSMSDLVRRSDEELRKVSNFSVELPDTGKVTFLEPVDLLSAAPDGTVATISLIPSRVVVIRPKLVIVYPGEEGKPPVGQGLNVPAKIELEDCWPLDRATRRPITDPNNERMKHHIRRLETMEGTEFISFDANTGKWTFKVFHFTVYGLLREGEDNEDIIVEDVDFVENEDGYMTRAKLHGLGTRLLGFNPSGDASMLNDSFVEDSFAYTQRAPQRRLVRRSEEEVDEDIEDLVEDMEDALEAEEELAEGPSGMIGEETTGDEGMDAEEPEAEPQAQEAGLPPSLAPQTFRQAMKASLFEKKAPAPRTQPFAPATTFEPRPFFGVAPPVRVGDDERVGGGSQAPRAMEMDSEEAAEPVPASQSIPSRPVVAVPPKTLRPLDSVVPIEKSIGAGKEGLIADAGLSMGRSFRVGWGPNGTFVTRGLVKDGSFKFATIVVRNVDVFAAGGGDAAKIASAETLQCHFDHSTVERKGETDAPVARVIPGSKFADYVNVTVGKGHYTETEQQAWKLGRALLDPLDIPSEREVSVEGVELSDKQKQYVREMYRKASVSRWLRSAVSKDIEAEIQKRGRGGDAADLVFSHLTGCNLAKACVVAASVGDLRLASVLSQLGASGVGPGAVRSRLPGQRGAKAACFGHGVPGSNFAPQVMLNQIKNQVQVWTQPQGKAQSRFFNDKRLRLWELAAGNVATNLVGGSLSDWKRVFGLFLWYEDGGANNLAQVVDSYDAACSSRNAQIAKPLPLYLEKSSPKPEDSARYDVLYHLLRLFVSERHLLETSLHPLNSTNNTLDYRLSWLLYTLISRSYKFREFRDSRVDSVVMDARDNMMLDGDAIQREAGFDVIGGTTADNLTMSLVFQLEKTGLWQWAVYVALFVSSPEGREKVVRELLCRNYPIDDKTDSLYDKLFPGTATNDSGAFGKPNTATAWDFLTRKLQIPARWIHEAKALRARYEGNLAQELASLLDAKHYRQAHQIIVRTLAPPMILNGQFALLRRLLAEVKDRSDVEDWNYGGDLLLAYMRVISPDGQSDPSAAATVPTTMRIGAPPTPSPSGASGSALRPFQASAFGVPSLLATSSASQSAERPQPSDLQALLDRIGEVERLQIKTGRTGISDAERDEEDLDTRACLAYMRKKIERLAAEARKKARQMDPERAPHLQPPHSTDNWFRGVGGLV